MKTAIVQPQLVEKILLFGLKVGDCQLPSVIKLEALRIRHTEAAVRVGVVSFDHGVTPYVI